MMNRIIFIIWSFQLLHDAAVTRTVRFEVPNASLHSLLTKYWELFSSKAPKGFGKFFGEEEKSKKSNDASKKQSEDTSGHSQHQTLEKEFKDFEKKIDRLFFKEKTKSSDGGGGKGRPIGGGDDKSTYYAAGFVGATAIVLAIVYYTYYAQSEISWKEFIG